MQNVEAHSIEVFRVSGRVLQQALFFPGGCRLFAMRIGPPQGFIRCLRFVCFAFLVSNTYRSIIDWNRLLGQCVPFI